MKKMFLLLCSLTLIAKGISLPRTQSSALLVGHPAPTFNGWAVVKGNIIDNFSLESFQGKYVILLFYPLDFTFVCPTELHAFQDMLKEFTERNVQVIACSIDSVYSHLAWLRTPYELGGIQGVEYPLISDLDKSISRSYHVLDEETAIAYRGLFIIDKKGIVRHCLVNDFPLGRNVEETLRLIDALTTYEKIGEVCPANWKPGDKTLKPSSEGIIDYFGN